MNDKELILDILKYLECQLEYGLHTTEKSEITNLIDRVKDSLGIEINQQPLECPECNSLIIVKWSGVECSNCNWWDCK